MFPTSIMALVKMAVGADARAVAEGVVGRVAVDMMRLPCAPAFQAVVRPADFFPTDGATSALPLEAFALNGIVPGETAHVKADYGDTR